MMEKPVIGVVGLGAMGLGIAQVFAQAGFSVLATDTQSSARGSAAARENERRQQDDRQGTPKFHGVLPRSV